MGSTGLKPFFHVNETLKHVASLYSHHVLMRQNVHPIWSISSRKRLTPVSDHIGLLGAAFWVVAYGRFD